MKCLVFLVASVCLVTGAPQNRKPVNQQSQDPQFIRRFNPDDDQNSQPQNFAPSRQQPQQQQKQQQQQAAQPSQRFTQQNNYQESTTFIPIIRLDNQQTLEGGYKTLWETGNNILAEETGVLKSFGTGENKADAVVQQGSYTYTSPEGQLITVQYTADEHGFRATGDHLPTPPPIPADIQKSLDVIYAGIASQQNSGRFSEGQYDEQQDQAQQNNRGQSNVNFRPQPNKFNNNNSNRG